MRRLAVNSLAAAFSLGAMRPQVSSLPPAARLLARPVIPPCPRTVCGVRNYAQTASARTRSLYSELSRPALSLDNARPVQKRWITQAYIQRMKDAEKEWQDTAKEIKAGKKKSFVEHLEERGLLHDVVGYVGICGYRSPFGDYMSRTI